EMSAFLVKDAIVAEINAKSADFICLNFANGDMVGHTGVYTAIQTAVKAIDQCVNEVVTACRANNYDVVIIADHGNADFALNADGSENTAHSLNPVPFIWVTNHTDAKVSNGILADVAPTLLSIMGLAIPSDMTGKVLIEK
ncbi:MAG TPA: alkaline phosphatase family protein, partial [Methylococcales bacterium]